MSAGLIASAGARTGPRGRCVSTETRAGIQVGLQDDLAADAEAVARADGTSLNETIRDALAEAVDRRRKDPEFKKRLRDIVEQDRELLERLAK
ncbi:MAG: hypothetical protein JJE52_05350 [Acidimicrobiia bacterium]|nr:hypothetical protein [Acidimicrobiia bacterium]